MLKLALLSFAGLCLSSAVSAARCPDKTDLDQGIVLTRDTPSFISVFRRDGVDLSERRESRGQVVHSRLSHALMTTERWEEGRDNHMALTIDVAPEEVENLRPGRQMQRDVTLRFSDGTEVPGRVSWKMIRNTFVHIGDCRYSARQIHERMDFEDMNPIRMVQFYAPDVGLVLRSITVDADWKPLREVQFDQIAVLP